MNRNNDYSAKILFVKNLRYLIDKYDIEQNILAADLGTTVTAAAITEWVKGRKFPRIDKIQALANYFGISIADLLEKDLSSPNNVISKKSIPVLGRIPAGIPIEMIDEILDYEDISADMLIGNREYFALKVFGDSMSPNYLNDDILIVLKQEDCNSGDDVIVTVNGDDATFKRVFKDNEGITLQPLNNSFAPIRYNNEDIVKIPVKILGVVVEFRRKTKKQI